MSRFATTLSIAVFLIVYSIFLVKIYPPLTSFDSYFHLAVGREVAQTHKIPKIDTFTFVWEGKEWISNEWLSGYFIFLIYSNFQETGILTLRASLGVLTLLFIYLTLRAQKVNFLLSLFTITFVGLAISVRMLDRPEMMSFTLFSILIYLLTLYQTKPIWQIILPIIPIFAMWPNIQGYAPVGLAVLGYYVFRILLAETAQNFSFWEILKKHKYLLIIFTLSALVALVQFKRFLYFLFLNKELFGYVSEVKPIFTNLTKTKYNFFFNIPIEYHLFFLFLTVATASFYIHKKDLILEKQNKLNFLLILDILYVLALCALALQFSRMVATFILLSTPLVINNLKDSLKNKEKYLLVPIFVIIAIMVFSIYQGKLVQERANTLYIFDKDNNIRVAISTTWKERRPTKALDFIKKNLEPQKLMTSLNWSNQTLWQLEGKTKVLIDIIYEKQTKESFGDYQKLAQNQGDIAGIVNKYNPDVIITTQPQNLVVPFEPQIYKLANWHLIYVDETTAVYAKDKPTLWLQYLHPEYTGDIKFEPAELQNAKKELEKLLALDSANGFARNQFILAYLVEKDYKSAERTAQESIKLSKNNPQYHILLAQSQIAQNNCYEAKQNAKKAKKLSNGYIYLKEAAQDLINKCQ